jgi:hypothetical protein
VLDLQKKIEEDVGEVRTDMRRALVSKRGGGVPGSRRNRRVMLADARSSDEGFWQPGGELSRKKVGSGGGGRGGFYSGQNLERGLAF